MFWVCKLCKKKGILSVFMVLYVTALLCACGADGTYVETSYDYEATADSYADTEEKQTEEYDENSFAWKSSLFEKPSTQYDNGLALVAAEMSDKAEDTTGEGIKKLFSDYRISNYKLDHYGDDGAFAIGYDTLCVNGIDTTVLVIVARGTQTFNESIGDLFKGPSQDFLDQTVWNNVYEFEEQIWNGLNEYLQKYPEIESADELKILVTGHSLGGAAANMVAARFTRYAEWGGWWSDAVDKEDIYAYTFGAIKVLTTENNASDGYENIHNVYNYYDSYGPNGNQKNTNASSLNAKFGHTDIYSLQYDEDGTNVWNSCNSHLMTNYKAALDNEDKNRGFIQLACEEDTLNENKSIESENDDVESIAVITDFSIEGKWKSIGEYGFGQAQPGAIVAFDGVNCNFYSPSDTYAFYQENGKWRLDCTDFLFAETVCFTVEIIDNDNIHIYYGSSVTELKRVAEGTGSEEHQFVDLEDFYIEGKWKNIGDDGFGQAQPEAIVAFDGTHCNYYSPYDTYAFYYDGSNYRLEVVGLLGDTCSFTVNIVDNDNIEVIDGYGAVSLMRLE